MADARIKRQSTSVASAAKLKICADTRDGSDVHRCKEEKCKASADMSVGSISSHMSAHGSIRLCWMVNTVLFSLAALNVESLSDLEDRS